TSIATTAPSAPPSRASRSHMLFFHGRWRSRGRLHFAAKSHHGFERCGIVFSRESWLRNNDGHRRILFEWHRMRKWRHRFGNSSTEPNNGFVRFGLPVGTAKSVGSSGVPFERFGILCAGLEILGKLESDHGVARLLEQIAELTGGVLACT